MADLKTTALEYTESFLAVYEKLQHVDPSERAGVARHILSMAVAYGPDQNPASEEQNGTRNKD